MEWDVLGTTEIRASSLPSYMDCSRRAASKAVADEIRDAGYDLTKLPPSAGAALGTASHAASEFLMQRKMDTGELGPVEDGIEHAVEKFGLEIADGVVWDDATPNRNTALIQLERQVRAYVPVMETFTPLALEMSLKADVGDGFVLSGHMDILTTAGDIRDEKYGALSRPYQSQLGAYSLLARSNGYQVTGLKIDWVQRVGKTKVQPPCQTFDYDVGESEVAAHGIIARVKQDTQAFRADPDGLWRAWPANPMSLMCSDKYCPAYGTNFCDAWKYRH